MLPHQSQLKSLTLQISGAVQGVGFRPFIYRLAMELQLRGWVNNNAQGVTVVVEGTQLQLELFLARLPTEKPVRSQIHKITQEWSAPAYYQSFEIHESTDHSSRKTVVILPDLATCDDCVQDIFNPLNRRYRYPFTNCTNCGSRYSIITALPYDRHHTTMGKFVMCADCQAEYDHPLDRRFQAQPNACPRCGPQLALWDRHGQVIATGNHALLITVQEIRAGKILAIKGLGGFQLVVDATNDLAIAQLRSRKQRPHKPFAVMYPSLEYIQTDCQVSALEGQLLTAPEAPIVLLRKLNKDNHPLISGNRSIGAMLPYTPLHYLLLAELQIPIIATSGNLASEPICIDNQEVIANLGNIADFFLVHNRDIAQPVDDSVVRVINDQPVILRRARGYAPAPLNFEHGYLDSHTEDPQILAVGGHLKNAIAISINNAIILSQHIGDLETTKAFDHFQKIIQRLSDAYEFQPDVIACDAHPDYLSSQYARQLAQDLGIPLIPVQHHYAHVLAAMADRQMQPPVLGIAWDGTGYGVDSTIWGGEFLKITQTGFERVAHLRKFPLLGGDRAAKEPRRVALAMLWEIFGESLWEQEDSTVQMVLATFSSSELRMFRQILKKQPTMPQTSSMGRLFDAVASLLDVCHRASFEGQAAIALEDLSGDLDLDEFYPLDVKNNGEIGWTSLITSILENRQNQIEIAIIAIKFHNSLVEVIVQIAKQIGIVQVVLTGGCFQNRYLTERAIQKLQQAGFRTYTHQQISPNDGGLAVGQIMAVMQRKVLT
ncbi:carbamoyltransferase HypF [Pseudanabaena mucicola]|uniref:Carbamoyltransferase n=1 Tax=Pseudanabaena mucicola FACHB-723 TaxID=2692860 RepID=A0ABR7ZZF5_9CYAN|nr:carbamoyltransferase HypF [Pseudanabaena mucicola]MBD2189332.1 carbamoyltransferase HypF [Pseudanabaena mucicola FACHB-723]